jgi:hypothetical protein
MYNCLIRCNYTASYGGGVYALNNNGTNFLYNCTIVSNYSSSGGGGIYEDSSRTYTSHYENCVIYLNSSPSGSNYYFGSSLNETTFTNCCLSPALSGVVTNASVNNITNDPQFAGWSAGDFHLSSGSPCVNAGVNSSWMDGAFDLDGHSRIDHFSRLVDMGCYEYLPSGSMYGVGLGQ